MGILLEICKALREGSSMNDVITPEEFEERLITIRETSNTDARCLYQMSNLIVEVLSDLGYEDGAEVFADVVADSLRW